MPGKRTAYIDACVSLAYINGDADRVPTIDAIFREALSFGGSIRLYTSMISIAEVAFGAMEQRKSVLDAPTEQKINALWLPGSPIGLVEYYRLIGDDAKGLMRVAVARGWSLKALDAIHLATARRMEVTEFLTYDKKLRKYAQDAGFAICDPYMDEPSQQPLPLGDEDSTTGSAGNSAPNEPE